VTALRRAADAPARARLNLPAIALALRHLQGHLADADLSEDVRRDPLDERVTDNLLAGYAFVDALVAEGIDVFAMGQLKHILEMNALVLCGTSPARREAYARHIEATERRFYEERPGGIEDLVEWYAAHRSEPARARAAGAYTRILSRPQLFIEGNHRTGALLMSYVLQSEGEPPFVLSPDTRAEYFAVSGTLRSVDRKGAAALLRLPALKQQLTELLSHGADPRYLLAAA